MDVLCFPILKIKNIKFFLPHLSKKLNLLRNINYIYQNMIIGQNQYNRPSGLLARFLPEWGTHEHIPHKGEGVMDTILDDHSITAFHVVKRAFQGIVISLSCAAFMHFIKPGDRKIVADRVALNPSLFGKRFRFHFAYGALAGVAWYFIYDVIFCPHESATYFRHVLAHTLGGALVTMTLFHPSSVVFGATLGTFIGVAKDSIYRRVGPKGFEVSHPGFSEEQREKAKRDDVEKMLSRKFALANAENNCNAII